MLEDLKPTQAMPEQYKTFGGHNIDGGLDAKNWGGEVNPSDLAIQSTVENLKQLPRIGSEGIKAGTDAANALFAQNTVGISSALSARARRSFQRNQQQGAISSTLNNVQRQRVAMAKNASEQQKLFELRRANFAGQLQWADQVANYNQAMETTKLGLLGSIISGGMAVAGMAMGGPGAAAAAGKLAKGAET